MEFEELRNRILDVLDDVESTRENTAIILEILTDLVTTYSAHFYISNGVGLSYEDLEERLNNYYDALKKETLKKYRAMLISELY